MNTKLHINLTQGVLDVEGDADFVREIYNDFKDRLAAPALQQEATPTANAPKAPRATRKPAPRKKPKSEAPTDGPNPNNPRLDKNLDTSKLPAFYGQFEPKNNYEKILIFLMFLTKELGIAEPDTDQVYTCFDKMKERLPGAYRQAFIDAAGKHGFIETADDLRVTIKGKNHFDHDLKRKDAE